MYSRLFDLLPHQCLQYPQQIAFSVKQNGEWETFSSQRSLDIVNALSTMLLDMGITEGQRVALIDRRNTPAWTFHDLALQQIGAVPVPLYPTLPDETIEYVLNHAEITYCFTGDEDLLDRLNRIKSKINSLQAVHQFALPENPQKEIDPRVEKIANEINGNDLATIIYTSGTTGNPKGVMLSHYNIICNITSTISMLPIEPGERALSFLPLCHIFERMVIFTYIAAGISIRFGQGPEQLMSNIREVKAHYITAVPLLLERVFDKIQERGRRGHKLSRRIFNNAIELASKFDVDGDPPPAYKFRLAFYDFLVFRRWRKALGGNLKGVVVGAAALQPRLGRLFSAAGIPIREGYGLTETSPVLTFNRFEPGGVRFGTVGIPVPGVEIKLDEDGEVLAKGPNVMLGYLNDEASTESVLDQQGWFRTGDLGEWYEKRFLKIIGRKSDAFKTASGKFINPNRLEGKLRTSNFIDQSFIFGLNQSHPLALIVPNEMALEEWCNSENIHWTSLQFMVLNRKVLNKMEFELDQINSGLPGYEQISNFTLLHEHWTEQNGLLTPTLKLKRRVLSNNFKKEIHELLEKQ